MRARGTGHVYQRTYRDPKTGALRTTSTWTIEYQLGRRMVREGGWRSGVEAEKALRERLTARDAGRPTGPAVERTTFEDLEKLIRNDYTLNGRRIKKLDQTLSHLRETFAGNAAITIVEQRIADYAARRVEAKAKNATVNRELSTLRRMLRLGWKFGIVGRRPDVTLLREDPARSGFFEPHQLAALLAHLPEDLRPFVEALHITGWRVDEMRTRQWRHVDLDAGWLRLEPGQTKNRDGRMFPLTPQLRAILEAQRARTDELMRTKGIEVPWVFWRRKGPGVHEDGWPVRFFRRAWVEACDKAGFARRVTAGEVVKKVPLRLVHDFRRTAVRNLERAGVPRSAAMRMVGHKTESIYRRYAIVDEGMLKEAAEKLAALHAAQALVAAREVADRVEAVIAKAATFPVPASRPPVEEPDARKLVAWDGIEPPTRGFSGTE